MRLSALLLGIAACGNSPCEDPDGDELPSCVYNAQSDEGSVDIEYCPGDTWGAADGCNSCGCDGDGNILCTSYACTEE